MIMNAGRTLTVTLLCSTLALIGASVGCEVEERPATPPPPPEEQLQEQYPWPEQQPLPPEPEGDQPEYE